MAVLARQRVASAAWFYAARLTPKKVRRLRLNDAIYKDKNGNFVIVESKATGGEKPNDPCGTKGDLCVVSDGRQMSNDWLRARINALKVPPLTPAEKQKLTQDFAKNPSPVQKVLSRTDKDGNTSFNQIISKGEKDVVVGTTWNP